MKKFSLSHSREAAISLSHLPFKRFNRLT